MLESSSTKHQCKNNTIKISCKCSHPHSQVFQRLVYSSSAPCLTSLLIICLRGSVPDCDQTNELWEKIEFITKAYDKNVDFQPKWNKTLISVTGNPVFTQFLTEIAAGKRSIVWLCWCAVLRGWNSSHLVIWSLFYATSMFVVLIVLFAFGIFCWCWV